MEVKRTETLKEQNARHQREYKARQKEKDLTKWREQKKEEMREYRAKRKAEEEKLKPKKEEPIKTLDIKAIVDETNLKATNRRTATYQKKQNKTNDIVPLHTTRNTPLETSTIDEYIRKLNILHKLYIDKPLSVK